MHQSVDSCVAATSSKVCCSILKTFLICRFIGERNRSLGERLFWVFFVSLGIFGSAYFTVDLIQKWQNSPVFMSVESTSYHVKNIPFPAVTICSVNKGSIHKPRG